MSHHRCCKCGGDGGDDCCVCGRCWMPRGVYSTPAVATLSGDGIAPNCCGALGPVSAFCGHESEIGVCKSDLSFDAGMGVVSCHGVGSGDHDFVFTETFCGGETGTVDLQASLGTRFTPIGTTLCPNFRLPGSGAICRSRGYGGSSHAVIMYAGSEITGPLFMASTAIPLFIDPGGAVLRCHIFTVTGGGGGAAVIAWMQTLCGYPCIDGCTFKGVKKISGSASAASGALLCDDKEHAVSGSFSASISLGCEFGDNCFVDGDDYDDRFVRCLETGVFNVSMDYSCLVDLGSALADCPPSPPRGSDGDIGDTDTPMIVIPQEWLDAEPVLREAYDAIREFLGTDGDASQTPPPGGQFGALGDVRNPTDEQIEQHMSNDPMRRGGCCG